MAVRAQWKGFLVFGEVTCPVSLYTAASTAERVTFTTLNRATGNRVRREFVDAETGKLVEREAQVKGYEVGDAQYVVLTPEEVAAAVPDSDKSMRVQSYIPCKDIDDTFFDKPYYLSPTDRTGYEAYALIRDGMRKAKVAAIAQALLFRRVRTVLVRAHGDGLIATTLNFDYEVRSAKAAFSEVPDIKIAGEMLELAKHIIKTKAGEFDPRTFDDRYDAALTHLVRAKLEGRSLPKRKAPSVSKPSDLMEALRMSAGVLKGKPEAANTNPAPASTRRKSASPSKAAKGAAAAAPQRKAG